MFPSQAGPLPSDHDKQPDRPRGTEVTLSQNELKRPFRRRSAVMTKYALYVPLEAKPGKEKEVAEFLRSALPLVNAEPGTKSWFAIEEGPSRFAIFDTFEDEAGVNAHLNGKVAAALMQKAEAGDLFAKRPQIHKLSILADKLPG
jgi:quinol monooxygenase YgiN